MRSIANALILAQGAWFQPRRCCQYPISEVMCNAISTAVASVIGFYDQDVLTFRANKTMISVLLRSLGALRRVALKGREILEHVRQEALKRSMLSAQSVKE